MSTRDFLVKKVAEEATEVAQAALKLSLYGAVNGHYNNLENLIKEMKDLNSALSLLSLDYPKLKDSWILDKESLAKAMKHYPNYEGSSL